MAQHAPTAQVMAIGGSDPSGGAGIQADIKSIHANGGYAVTVVSSITVQNTRELTRIHDLPAQILADQIAALCADFAVGAVKTGMLHTADQVSVVADEIEHRGLAPLVVDPVMVATAGPELQTKAATKMMIERLLPLARVCTPNTREAETICGLSIRTRADVEESARRIQMLGPRAVLITGGHLDSNDAADLLLDGHDLRWFSEPRIAGVSPHGAGCTLASSIATRLALGEELHVAVEHAKRYVTGAIRHWLAVGKGHPPLDHFYFLTGNDPLAPRADPQKSLRRDLDSA